MSRWPAIVKSVDRERREVRVEIPGVTDGAEEMPIAEIEYPIGDKSEHTEIRILEGDRVWVEFIAGDSRYPIITGYRPKQTGNEVGTRRWHHDNIHTNADETQLHEAGTSITLDAGETITVRVGGTTAVITDGKVEVTGADIVMNASSMFTVNGDSTLNGNVTVSGTVAATGAVSSAASVGAPTVAAASSLTVAGKEMGEHIHGGVESGSSMTSPPV